jgi:hypothetical protein
MATDPSDAMPPGGYLLPNFPAGWLRDGEIVTAVLSSLDVQLDAARSSIGTLKAAHLLASATGSDLDDLAALLGLVRATGESDSALRARIPATAQHGVSASAGPDLASYLSLATNVTTSVVDGSTPGTAVVVFTSTPQLPLFTVQTLVNSLKALGISMGGRQALPGPQQGTRVGAFRLGTRRAGGTGGTGQSVVLW